RERFGFAPMRILQFGFGTEADSAEHLPHNYARLCAAYTGNHDNNTLVGGLDDNARMNVPGTMEGNWTWRLPAMPSASVVQELRLLTNAFGRNSAVPCHAFSK